jgi:Nuclease-related domain
VTVPCPAGSAAEARVIVHMPPAYAALLAGHAFAGMALAVFAILLGAWGAVRTRGGRGETRRLLHGRLRTTLDHVPRDQGAPSAATPAELRALLKSAAGESNVALCLGELGFPHLHDVILTARDGSLTQIDHVVLTAAGLVAIETKTYAGAIFGAEREAEWTQNLGGGTSRFRNPLWQNFKHVDALRYHLGHRVQGLVVFAGSARFPRGVPPGVTLQEGLAACMNAFGRPTPNQAASRTWRRACRIAEHGRGLHQAHLDGLRARHPPAAAQPAGPEPSVPPVGMRRFGAGGTAPAPFVGPPPAPAGMPPPSQVSRAG